jgi:hypothetical protein
LPERAVDHRSSAHEHAAGLTKRVATHRLQLGLGLWVAIRPRRDGDDQEESAVDIAHAGVLAFTTGADPVADGAKRD